ncbi:MAG TPA: hypothetical protein VMZ04_03175 [Anaerolineae bacterium]|nr:hypothetical protein [Anaerolineae bacterium]
MMEIVGKILLLGGLFVFIICQIYLMAFVFKIKYQSAVSFIVLPSFALINESIRKQNIIPIFLCGASLPMVILGAYVLAVV